MEQIPSLTMDEGAKHLNFIRSRNQGRLSGLTFDVISGEVEELMRRERECPVCFEQMTEEDSEELAQCGHLFHTHCVREWQTKSGGAAGASCPMCRALA